MLVINPAAPAVNACWRGASATQGIYRDSQVDRPFPFNDLRENHGYCPESTSDAPRH